jgi:hypothetical protein
MVIQSKNAKLIMFSLMLLLICWLVISSFTAAAQDEVATEVAVQDSPTLPPTDIPTDVPAPTTVPTDVPAPIIPSDIPAPTTISTDISVVVPTDVPVVLPTDSSASPEAPTVIVPTETVATTLPTALPTDLPTNVPPAQPVGLPYIDHFDNPTTWLTSGAWWFDGQTAYQGTGWYANTSLRGQTSTLELNTPVVLSANNPQLSFWYRAQLAGSDTIAIDVDLNSSGTWAPIREFNGAQINNPNWTLQTVDLTSIANLTAKFRVRVSAGSSDSSSGFWMDELTIQQVNPTPIPSPTQLPTATLASVLPSATPIVSATTPARMSSAMVQSSLAVAPATGSGLQGEYFDDPYLTELVLTRLDAIVNFDWSTNAPVTLMGADTFSVRWSGQIEAKYTETYTIYTQADDGVRVWMNGQQLINDWTNHATAVENSRTIALVAGQRYNIVMESFENTGGASATLLWSSPSQAKQIIPKEQLYPPATLVVAPPSTEPVPQTAGTGNGLKGDYYNNGDFTSLVLSRTDANINFNWSTGSPASSVGADTFSVRWTGQVQPLYSQTYTFYTVTDDGVRLWVNGQQLVNDWTSHSATQRSGSITLVAGQRYDIRMEYYEGSSYASAQLQWSSPSQPKQVIPQSQLYGAGATTVPTTVPPTAVPATPVAAAAGGTGLKGDYYNNGDLTSLVLSRTDATINFNWGTGSPASSIGADTFSVRWTGQVQPLYSQTYTFYTVTNDGARLWVNGQQLVNDWTSHTATQRSGSITLVAGQRYNIKMEFFDNDNSASAQLLWSSTNQAKQVIPQSQLFPASGSVSTPVPTTTSGGGTGLKGEYFDNANLTNFITSRTDPFVNMYWTGAPAQGMGADTYAVRWTGQIQPRYSQTYTFYTVSDDGIHLWVNGQHLVSNWTDHGSTENSGSIALQANQKYNITIEYYQNSATATAQLLWSSPSQPKQIVPQSQLFPTTGTQPSTVSPTPTPVVPTPVVSTPVPGAQILRPFNTNSVWNRPVPSNVTVAPNSAAMINLLTSTIHGEVNIDGITGSWSVPVYYADSSSPLQTVCDSAGNEGCYQVRVPTNVIPSPDGDAKTVIIDQSFSPTRAWSFWQFRRGPGGAGGDWLVSRGAFGWADVTTSGDGIRNHDGGEWGGRVSSWNYYAGLIQPAEIQQGRIDHALHFNIPQSIAARYSVWPARSSDGLSYDPNAIPVGTWVQLDPNINVNNLNLSPGGKVIARALQVYGAFIGDTGEMAAFNAREYVKRDASGNPVIDSSPWSGLLTYRDLYNNLPVGSFRILVANPANYYQEP